MNKMQLVSVSGALLSLAIVASSSAFAQEAPAAGSAPQSGAHHYHMDPEAMARTTRLAAGDTSPEAMEVLEFERKMEAAVVRGDVAYVSSVLSPDFIMVHGDTWCKGGKPLLMDNKESFLKRVENKQYLSRDLDSVRVELHGDTAITYGRYVAQNRIGPQDRSWFSVWFERVYQKQNGKWMYLSHRTVHGPTFGPDRATVSNE